jgi:hypothetical protein
MEKRKKYSFEVSLSGQFDDVNQKYDFTYLIIPRL